MVRIVQIVSNSANNGEQSRIVANIVANLGVTQNLGVNLAATWNGIFPLESIDAYRDKKVYVNVIS